MGWCLNFNLSTLSFRSRWLSSAAWIIDSSISPGLTFTVESSSSAAAVRSSQGARARRKEWVRASVRGHAALLWKHTAVKNTTERSELWNITHNTHTNTYVQIAAGLGLAFVVRSWLHGEFTLSLWYYPIQPVWPSGNPLFSHAHHLNLIRQAPDTVKRSSLAHNTDLIASSTWAGDHTLPAVCVPPAVLRPPTVTRRRPSVQIRQRQG